MAQTAAAHAQTDTLSTRPGDRRTWDRLLRQAGKSSLEQSWAYGEAVASLHGAAVTRRIVYCGERPLALVQGFRTRDVGLASINRVVRGPLWLGEVSAAQRLDVYRAVRRELRRRYTDVLFWLPELADSPDSRQLMAALGMRRMVTGYATVWLDIRPDKEHLLRGLRGKWRNSLRAAEKSDLRVRAAERGRAFEESMAAYEGFRRSQRFIGPPAELIRLMRNSPGTTGRHGAVRVWLATHASEVTAGIAVARHGASATYLAGWTSEAGRHRNAHNLLLWRAIGELRITGTDWLDLGGVDSQSAPGIARFKLGLGGELATLAGTFL